jgi:prepilin-type N-terminal cleavage/methylation domain-containing protein
MKEENGLRLSRKGFTLIELLVAMVLSFILIGAIYGTFTSQQKSYTVQDQVAETQQNARMAMNILMRDIRMAGYGMPDGGVTIGKTTYSNAIHITKNGKQQSFDSITLVGAFGAPICKLAQTIDAGSTEIFLHPYYMDFSKQFDTGDKQYIFIGGIDKLKVAGVAGNKITLNGKTSVRFPTAILTEDVEAGAPNLPVYSSQGLKDRLNNPDDYDVLTLGKETIIVDSVTPDSITVDTDPEAAGNQPITGDYFKGNAINPIPVFRVTAVEYSIDNYSDPEHEKNPAFTREDRALGVVAELAGNIQDIQIEDENFQDVDINDKDFYYVTLTAQTRIQDPDNQENQKLRNLKED